MSLTDFGKSVLREMLETDRKVAAMLRGDYRTTDNGDGTVTFKIAPEDPKAQRVKQFITILENTHREMIREGLRPYNPMGAVAEWHKAVGEKPFIELDEDGRGNLAVLRNDLITEEAFEVGDELKPLWSKTNDFSRACLAAELADLLYVAYGTAQLFEIDLPAVFELVHRKNMEKVDKETGEVVRREDGKIQKPEGFKPLTEADIEAVIN